MLQRRVLAGVLNADRWGLIVKTTLVIFHSVSVVFTMCIKSVIGFGCRGAEGCVCVREPIHALSTPTTPFFQPPHPWMKSNGCQRPEFACRRGTLWWK